MEESEDLRLSWKIESAGLSHSSDRGNEKEGGVKNKLGNLA